MMFVNFVKYCEIHEILSRQYFSDFTIFDNTVPTHVSQYWTLYCTVPVCMSRSRHRRTWKVTKCLCQWSNLPAEAPRNSQRQPEPARALSLNLSAMIVTSSIIMAWSTELQVSLGLGGPRHRRVRVPHPFNMVHSPPPLLRNLKLSHAGSLCNSKSHFNR